MAKHLKSGDIKQHLRSQKPSQDTDRSGADSPEGAHVGQDIANIFATLQKISSELTSLEDIRRTTASVESKLSSLISRMGEVEKRVEWLEDTEKQMKAKLEANPIATKSEVDELRDKLEDMENRSRRNNLRFVGVPEGKESGDMTVFMQELLISLLGLDDSVPPLEIDRAHRAPTPRPNPGERPRAILVRFLRSVDRECVLRTARNKSKLVWEGNHIMIFPDFSRATQLKREKFRECKKALRERNIKFALLYPAILRIDYNGGQRRFDNPKKAMEFIQGTTE